MSEYERGFRDGISKAAHFIGAYIERFGADDAVPMSGDAVAHLRMIQEGLQMGIIFRDIEGRGE